MKRILVSATSIVSGGALNILKQFINNADSLNQYYLALNKRVVLEKEYVKSNFHYFYIDGLSKFDRICWDFYGAHKYIKDSGLTFDLVVSLQNTTLRVPDVKQIVYLHQGLILHDRSWNVFDSLERKYAIYKYLYPVFVFAFSVESTVFVVQTKWMKNSLIKKFNISRGNIKVFKPDVLSWLPHYDTDSHLRGKKITLFYPASGEVFKNHLIILKSMHFLHVSGVDISKFKVIFTLTHDSAGIRHIINFLEKHYPVKEIVSFQGHIAYADIRKTYDAADVMIFPSEIESFGLPLLEAAYLGKEVLCLDTDFSREVLNGYGGAKFIDNRVEDWASVFLSLIDCPSFSHKPLSTNHYSDWVSFFKLF